MLTYTSESVLLTLPLREIGNPGDLRAKIGVGTESAPTDCAPDGTYIQSGFVKGVPTMSAAGAVFLGLALAVGGCVLLARTATTARSSGLPLTSVE